MTDTTFRVETVGNGTFAMPFNTGDPYSWTRGGRATFTFEFPEFRDNLVVSSNQTISGVESYDSVTVESGATLTVSDSGFLQAQSLTVNGTLTDNGTVSVNADSRNALEAYHEYAGAFSTLETLDTSLTYSLLLPETLPIDSLLWGVEPSADLQAKGVVGVWGLVESVRNVRTQPLTTNRYQVELTVLATFDDYASASDLETALKT